MRSQFDDDGQGPDISDVLSEVSAAMTANLKKLGPILVLGVAVATAVMGFFKVGPGEKGVVRRFGAEHRLVEPGLAFALPFVEAYDVVNVEAVRRVEVGFRGDEARPDEALMLTGDENIVEVRMVVQYRVKNPSSYLFRIREPEQILHATAEVALRTIAGRTKIDAMMTTGRADVQSDVKKMLQKYMNDYESGLEITDVKLDRVDAPDEVKDAFVAVTRAREEKEKLVNQAMGYREDQVPRARGKSSKQVQAAEAYAQERVLRAKGDAERFVKTHEGYRAAPGVTKKRLYIETMEKVVGRLKSKSIVDKELTRGSMPVLQLGSGHVPVHQYAGSKAAVAGGQRE
ncbi:MAG: FtsH protease activity modulator HflK [Polyangiaceae bacterium]|nr:FtsH protease activity modulator HflK [Polyangiaceae bacterium]